jgi:hypothetical protein
MHPGGRYLLLVRQAAQLEHLGRQVSVDCEGLTARFLELPDFVPADLRQRLNDAGIVVSRTLHVEPVGLAPRQWDGESAGEWLTTETPCFLLTRDHPFDSVEVSIDEGEPVAFAAAAGKAPLFFTLPRLGAGSHRMEVRTRSATSSHGCTSWTYHGHSQIRLAVREPSSWIPGQLCHPAMVVDIDPVAPTLDDLVDERLSLQVHGDQSRTVSVALVLCDAAGVEASPRALFSQRMPLTAQHWSDGWRVANQKERDDYQYLTAGGGYLLISNADLGDYRVPLQRQLHPLRWVMRKSKAGAELRLINDGDENKTRVVCHRFATPACEQAEDTARHLLGKAATEKGGLFVAMTGDETRAVVIEPSEREHTLRAALGANIDLQALESESNMQSLLVAHCRWAQAEAATVLAGYKRNAVLKALSRRMLALTCGDAWMRKEDLLLGANAPKPLWNLLEDTIGHRPFAIALSFRWNNGHNWDHDKAHQLHAEVAASYAVGRDESARETAWRLAIAPETFEVRAAGPSADFTAENAVLVRAARYLHLRLTLPGGSS